MSAAVLLVLLPGASAVIAAPGEIDQPPTDRVSILLAVLLLALAPVAAVLIVRFRWHRLGRVRLRPEVAPPPVSLGLALLMLVLGAFGVQVAMRVIGLTAADPEAPLTLADQAALGLGAYGGQALAVLPYVWLLRQRRRAGGDDRMTPGRAVVVGVAALAPTWPLVNAAGWVWATVRVWLGGPAPETISHETLRLLRDSPRDGWFVVMALLAAVAAPVFEEVLYRGLLQDALRRVGLAAWPAIGVVSVIFATMHWSAAEPHALVALAVLSLGFGWAFERTGRLAAPIAMHIVFNVGNLLIALLAR